VLFLKEQKKKRGPSCEGHGRASRVKSITCRNLLGGTWKTATLYTTEITRTIRVRVNAVFV